MASQREVSRQNWSASGPSIEEINAGSLQRIADATEKMAAGYDAMQKDRDLWKVRCETARANVNHLALVVRSLRGVITKLKRSASSQVVGGEKR